MCLCIRYGLFPRINRDCLPSEHKPARVFNRDYVLCKVLIFKYYLHKLQNSRSSLFKSLLINMRIQVPPQIPVTLIYKRTLNSAGYGWRTSDKTYRPRISYFIFTFYRFKTLSHPCRTCISTAASVRLSIPTK